MKSAKAIIVSINNEIVNPLIILLSVTATLYFLWGLAQFAMNLENPEERENGKRKIIYGIIGLSIMVSVFGILSIVLNTFGITTPGINAPKP